MYKKNINGFTLVELIVTISIVTFMSTVVMFNYSTFSDNLASSAAQQEIAVAIREAQSFGVNVRESAVSSGRFDYAYGIHFDPQDPSSYYVFVDRTDSPFGNGVTGNRQYDVGTGCGTSSTECVEKFTLRNNVKVSGICDPSSCYTNKTLDIIFLRPNPDAKIYIYTGATEFSSGGASARVELTSQKGKVVYVKADATGQVLVQ